MPQAKQQPNDTIVLKVPHQIQVLMVNIILKIEALMIVERPKINVYLYACKMV